VKFARVVAVAGGLFLVVLGIWALIDPRSFYEQLATFPPYNRHFMHDVGAFQVGLGVTLLIALVWADALGVALAGVGVGAALHAVSHWVDRDLGGRSSDPYTLSILAIAFLVAAGMRHRSQGGPSNSA